MFSPRYELYQLRQYKCYCLAVERLTCDLSGGTSDCQRIDRTLGRRLHVAQTESLGQLPVASSKSAPGCQSPSGYSSPLDRDGISNGARSKYNAFGRTVASLVRDWLSAIVCANRLRS